MKHLGLVKITTIRWMTSRAWTDHFLRVNRVPGEVGVFDCHRPWQEWQDGIVVDIHTNDGALWPDQGQELYG
jgi:hypothetical protein